MIIISACLIGDNCKYNAGNNWHEVAEKLNNLGLVIPVCPEQLGGLPTPRYPAEIIDGKIISQVGVDVTKEYKLGAELTLQKALDNGVKLAILQARSPSCGSKVIYDGTFTGKLIKGQGVTAQLLKKHGIKVITIDDFMSGDYEKYLK